MPPEPKRPIEELLEASAKARRAEFGVDPAMPNPMRVRLHEEIARMNRTEETEPRRNWFAMFWPQISIATAVAAVLVTGAVLWQKKEQAPSGNMPLAMNAPVASENADAPVDALRSLSAAPQMAAAAPSVPAVRLEAAEIDGRLAYNNNNGLKSADSGAGEESNDLGKLAAVTVAPPEPAAAASALDGAGKDKEARVASRNDAPGEAAASAMSAPAQVFAAKARAPELTKNSKAENANVQQQFSQTARGQTLRNSQNARQAANILDNFQVEQNGREIRVVDADGSTYSGKFEPVPQTASRRMFKQTTVEPAPAPAAATAASGGMRAKTESGPTQNELFFRASGFNASLKKRVVFEGNYIPLPALEKKGDAKQKFDEAEQTPARIVGTAKVPGELPIEIDAATVAR